jgi:hypothetical protein
LRRTLSLVDRAETRTVLLSDTPAPPFNVARCFARRAWSRQPFDGACRFSRMDSIRSDVRTAEASAALGLSHVQIVDMLPAICNSEECDGAINGNIVYRGSHLTASFVDTLESALKARLGPITGEP